MPTNVTFPKMPLNKGLISGSYKIIDDILTSEYFGVRDLSDTYGKGVHSFTIDGSNLLIKNSSIYYELIDADGNVVPLNGITDTEQYPSYVFSFSVNDNVANGMAILSFVGCSYENNKNKHPNQYEYDVIWSRKIRLNVRAGLDFHEIVAVDNLSFLSGSISKPAQSGSSSENALLLSWESMYGHAGQSASQANGSVIYVSNFMWKQVEKYYIYMHTPTGSANDTASFKYPGVTSSLGVWSLLNVIEAPKLSASQFPIPTASIYYLITNLPQNKYVSFWVGTGKDTTFRNESSTAIQKIPVGTPTPITLNPLFSASYGAPF